jgi:hypothetical protein
MMTYQSNNRQTNAHGVNFKIYSRGNRLQTTNYKPLTTDCKLQTTKKMTYQSNNRQTNAHGVNFKIYSRGNGGFIY